MHICVHSHIAEIRKVTAKRVDFCSGMGILGLQEVEGEALAWEETDRLRAGGQVKLQIASG